MFPNNQCPTYHIATVVTHKKNKMKKIAATLFLLSISYLTYAQFGSRNIIENSLIGITKIVSEDLNNDGFEDIIISQNLSFDKISYYLNNGDGTFGSQQTIALDIENAETVATGDFNNDGWMDVVSASFVLSVNPDFLYVFTNNSGSSFTATQIDTQTAITNKISHIKTADIDNDNDTDIITIADGEFNIFYNDGAGNFTKNTIDPGLTTENYDLSLSDIDNDGFIDVILGGTQTLIYKNTNGVLNYDDLRTNSIVNGGLVFLVELNDFDNDGDNDLLISGNNNSDLRWYANDSNGFFTLSQIFQTSITQCRSAISRDFDQDGDIDIYTIFPQSGKVVWYDNLGNGNFSTENIIFTGDVPFTKYVYAADLTNNGNDDIIWAQQLSVHLNEFALSVDDYDLNNDFKIYPNPSSLGKLNISAKKEAKLSVFNSLGQMIYEDYKIFQGNNTFELNLKPQIYLLVIESYKFRLTKKIVVN